MLNDQINFRFMVNNFAKSDAYMSVSVTSEEALYPFSNASTDNRTKVYRAKGRFQITSTTNKIYINDGSNKTITLTAGEYTSAAALATHVQTQLNASSSAWTVTYSATTYKFTIAHTGSATLRFSQTSNQAWNVLGYMTIVDLVGTSWISNETRAHYPNEYIKYDMGYFIELGFVGIIGDPFSEFKISTASTITLEANTIDDFTSPPLSITLTRTPQGAFKFIDTDETLYRFIKITIQDVYNPLGPNGVEIGHIYVGDFQVVEYMNISKGFSFEEIDPSVTAFSESGVSFNDVKEQRTNFDNLTYGLIQTDAITRLKEIYRRVGRTTPFFVSLDPTLCVLDPISDLTRFVYFNSNLKFQHAFSHYFNMSFTLREAL